MLSVLVLFAVAFVLIYKLCFNLKSSNSFLPGPIRLPIIGNLLQLALMRKKYKFNHEVWKALVDEYGPIVRVQMGMTSVVIISDLKLIKELGSNDALQGRPDGFFYRKRALGGRGGLVFTEGALWAEQRRFCLSHLRFYGKNQLYLEKLICREAESLVDWLKKFNEKPMILNASFTRFVLNVIWSLTTGDRYDRDDPKLLGICDVLDKSFRRMNSTGSILNQLPVLRFIAPELCGYNEYCKLQLELIKFIRESIQEHKLNYNHNMQDDLLGVLIRHMNNENSLKLTDNDLYIICLDLLQAGTDTTSNTMSFIALYMLRHQDVQKKVHAEIDEVIGRTRKPTLEDKRSMPYLSAVIQEVQRIANIAPGGVAHRTMRDTHLGVYSIPKETVILTLLYGIHKDDKLWNDPDTFKPERFLSDDGKLLNIDAFLPFGTGKRRCVGEVLAKANLFIFCCYLFQRFHLMESPHDASKTYEIIDGITLSPAPFHGIWKIR